MYKPWNKTLPKVYNLAVMPQVMNITVRVSPKSLIEAIFVGETEETRQVSSLPLLYANGKLAGTLHGGAPEQAEVLAKLLEQQKDSKQKWDLALVGHDTESGSYIDSLELIPIEDT
ncbi:MAG: hypothetical protein K2W82_11090 [Candidatus Obscuribacterales bacterium]|nr:hypothetical protein [Candidatus Obscuribacterales bacterium]